MKRVAEVVLNGEGTIGGEQRHVLAVVDGLDPERYRATVITWDIPAFVEEVRGRGIAVVPVTARRILDLELLRRLERELRAGKFDLVHAHGHRAGLLARLAAIRAGVPHVMWTCHLAENKADRNVALRFGYRAAMRYLDRRTERTVTVSDPLRDWLIREGLDAARIEVVPNGVDAARFHPGPRNEALLEDLGLYADAPVVGTVARLTEQKGVGTLIDAAGLVTARVPGTQFVVVGGGPLETSLRERAARSGARVVFAGERSDVPALLRLFDIAVVPSLWEGAFCFSVLEAMATRRPVVCSDIPLFTDVVTSGSDALVFPVGDPAALSAAVLTLMERPELADAIAGAGMRLVAERFSAARLSERMNGIYDEVLRGEPS